MSDVMREVSFGEAVLWLNDHLDERVLVRVCAAVSDEVERIADTSVLRVAGDLDHWRNDDDAETVQEFLGESIIGFHRYRVGDSVFLVPDEEEGATFHLADDELVVQVGGLALLIERPEEEAA
jgi:hypothetical protein